MAFSMGEGQDYEGLGEGEVWWMIDVTGTPPVYTDGEWLKATFSGSPPMLPTVTIYEFNIQTEKFTEITPEPATIALFCLGGLMLRRNK